MKAVAAAAMLALLWTEAPAFAHRLDEYLQATIIAVERDHVSMQLCLTPGVEVFRATLADIDTDQDGVMSESEQHAAAERMLRALSLIVDGQRLPLRLISLKFPQVAEMQEGLGDIRLGLEADVPPGGFYRRLIFENHYQSGMSFYLVNCLSPKDSNICITAQNRNNEQSWYQVEYTQTGASSPRLVHSIGSKVRAWMLVDATAVFASLALLRRWLGKHITGDAVTGRRFSAR